ncbi:hypothetical protein BKA70DRAFT_1349978 [Coprinopsis sp. MPI-PUGE-AT-0042]|nr:hypothetical protein BKA70DRAFT_1349978 [Coprinopsis sp. MPI-PUGE-AT-0042]
MKPNHRLLHFLKVNDPLPDFLLSHLNAYLDHHDELIALYDIEITRLNQRKRHLCLQRETYAPLRASGRRIPGEVLAMIMHWAIGGPDGFVDSKGRQDFLQFRHVARLWRHTAFSSPQLWRFLRIDAKDLGGGLATMARLTHGWFGRAGKGAGVHLDIAGSGSKHPIGQIGAMWDLEERSDYQITCLRLWASFGIDLEQPMRVVSGLRSLTVTIGKTRYSSVRGSPLILNQFNALESLAVRGAPSHSDDLPNLSHTLCHPRLRYLYLSGLYIANGLLAVICNDLPLLEELIFFNCNFEQKPSPGIVPLAPNSSIKRIIAPIYIVAWWQGPDLSSLEYCKILQSDEGTVAEDYHYLLLTSAAANLQRFNPHNLTLDLTCAELGSEDLVIFLPRLPPLRSLRMKSLAQLFTEEPQGWSLRPVLNIICNEYFPLPLRLSTTTPSECSLGSSSSSLLLFAPSDGSGSSHYRCTYPDPRFMGQFPFNLIRIPRSKIDALQHEFPCQHHECTERGLVTEDVA